MGKVRCAECGFLAVKRKVDDVLCEVGAGLRDGSGQWPLTLKMETTVHETFPVCYVRAAQLPDEAKGTNFLAVVQTERNCPSFTPWQQGFGPKGHAEMLQLKRMEELAEERRRADEERAERRRKEDKEEAEQRHREDLEWQKKRDGDQREWQAEQAKRQARQGLRNSLIVAFFAAVLTLIVGYVTKSGLAPTLPQPAQEPSGPKPSLKPW